jgi:DNA-binding transcriptional ArsR family regulator
MNKLEAIFGALADGTRRAMLERLRAGERSISELAQSHAMTVSGALKHVRVLEGAGLVCRHKRGRTVWCQLDPAPLKAIGDWVARYEVFWDGRLDALGEHLAGGRTRARS